MLGDIANLLVVLLVLVSGFIWWRAVWKLKTNQPLLPYRERKQPRWNPWVVLIALCWIAYQLIIQFTATPADEKGKPSLEIVKTADEKVKPPLEIVKTADEKVKPPSELENVKTFCVFSTLVLLVLFTLLIQAHRSSMSEFGFDLRHWRQQLADGALGFLASGLPTVAALLLITPLRKPGTEHTYFKILDANPGLATIAWIGLAVIVLAPLIEELLYRVILQGFLQTRTSPAWAIGLSSVTFAAVHGFPNSLALLPLSVILGYVYYRRHSYLSVVVLHALFNGWNLIVALLKPA